MMKKLCIIFLLLFSCFFISGCDKKGKKQLLLFNRQEITKQTVYDPQEIFAPGQTIHYVLLMPKGFKWDYLKLQIVKRPDNVPYGGMQIYYAADIFVDMDKKFYIDKFALQETGYYVVRVFYANRPNKPIIECNLWVKN